MSFRLLSVILCCLGAMTLLFASALASDLGPAIPPPGFDAEELKSYGSPDDLAGSEAGPALSAAGEGLTVTRAEKPGRSLVQDADGQVVATFTDGASTVALHGPERVFDDQDVTDAVTSTTWVRVLAEPFDGEVDGEWLAQALTDDSPDVLATAMEYLAGSPDQVDGDGLLVAASASYGPLQPDGDRPVGSDWHDFQGVDAVYDGIVDPADPTEFRSLDCSGYVRMIYGVRFGVEMSLRPDGGTSLPRRSMEQAADAPGVVPIPNEGSQAAADDRLQPGDLVFFDAPSDDDGVIDHVGIYLGVDDGSRHRFVHSRRSSNGPTLGGDAVAPSVLDGDDFFARGFRSTRRL